MGIPGSFGQEFQGILGGNFRRGIWELQDGNSGNFRMGIWEFWAGIWESLTFDGSPGWVGGMSVWGSQGVLGREFGNLGVGIWESGAGIRDSGAGIPGGNGSRRRPADARWGGMCWMTRVPPNSTCSRPSAPRSSRCSGRRPSTGSCGGTRSGNDH